MGNLRRQSRGSQGQAQHLRTLRNGLAATVPHSLLAYDINCSQRGQRRYTRRQSTLQQHAENMELRCCRINVLLVTMQTFLGVTITALGFYMQTLTTSLPLYETPFWAGFPVSCISYSLRHGFARSMLNWGFLFKMSFIYVNRKTFWKCCFVLIESLSDV